ncbi:cyclin-D1-binding protein 1 homolog [Saccostrea echinata]|uniref:cyclin-D1-binding protein 1 homolog n=1 Tax=Saccostrea echinata TaxID=191078 RepID=UPI002A80FCA3|nr:cyclin-D1-binding protein 1 homolog [Saccostrea echinata]
MAENIPHGSPVANFLQNIDLARRQIRDESSSHREDGELNADKLWSRMENVFKIISHEATKISLAFSGSPVPSEKECTSLFSSAEQATLALVSVFYSLPTSQGLRLKKSTKEAILSLLDSLRELISSIHEGCRGNQQQLQSTGAVWQDADVFSTIPKNNKEAVIHELKISSQLIRDALTELEQAIEEGGSSDGLFGSEGEEEGPQWTELDKTVTKPCVGLIKTTKSLLKKTMECVQTNGQTQQSTEIQELDKLADLAERLSPAVDDLILDLYPPMVRENVQEKGKTLYDTQKTILEFLRSAHMTGENEQKWLEFLLKANQHNYENILKSSDDNFTK